MDITERAFEAVGELMKDTSGAPTIPEMVRMAEQFAREFAFDAGLKLCTNPDSEGAVIAVRNVIDRAARGEP